MWINENTNNIKIMILKKKNIIKKKKIIPIKKDPKPTKCNLSEVIVFRERKRSRMEIERNNVSICKDRPNLCES
jgi:hypothetical protein